MKNIANYKPDKYLKNKAYAKVEEDIYVYDNPPDTTFTRLQRTFKLKQSHGFKYQYGPMLTNKLEPKLYVTSLTFEQEPALGEGDKPSNISQYPLEDVLDKFLVHISDFYSELNGKSSKQCHLEFASSTIEDVRRLREIIGKHVYNNKGELSIE